MRMYYVARLAAAAAVLGTLWMPPAQAQGTFRDKLLTIATHQIGIPYVWGGATRHGFDCSGLVQFVFRKAGVKLPRTADKQFSYGVPVLFNHLRPGDLLFFNTGHTQGQVTHVGIYVGHDRMLHAPRTGKNVQYAHVGARSWFRPRLLGIRRVTRHTYELARQPVGWEAEALPKGVTFHVGGDRLAWSKALALN